MRSTTAVPLLACLLAGPALAEPSTRWLPEHCLEYRPASADPPAAAALWNDAYRRSWIAIERGQYDVAESEMCRAALAARNFDPRDWRFAETLDELGRIAFELRDFELAERMEGAAIAEMLLAVGPEGEPLSESGATDGATIRPDCRSGVSVYTQRLGWILERRRGRTTVDDLRRAPWSVFAAGYVPLDADLAQRLDWLVAQYLLSENVVAADALIELQGSIRGANEKR